MFGSQSQSVPFVGMHGQSQQQVGTQQNSPFGNTTPDLARFLAEQAVSYARSNPHDANAQQWAARYAQHAESMAPTGAMPTAQFGPMSGAAPVPSNMRPTQHMGPTPTPPMSTGDLHSNPFSISGQPLQQPQRGPSHQHGSGARCGFMVRNASGVTFTDSTKSFKRTNKADVAARHRLQGDDHEVQKDLQRAASNFLYEFRSSSPSSAIMP